MRLFRSFILLLIAGLVLDSEQLSAAAVAASIQAPAVDWLDAALWVAIVGVTLSTNALTLADWAKRLDPDGKVAAIVEMLMQTNEILDDMLWIEGNLPTGHRSTIRTGLPVVYWRMLNQGVPPSKSQTAQVDEQAGMLEAWSEVDVDLAMLNGNTAAFRLSEAKAFIEAMNQEMASTLFYGNPGLAPEEFTGLAPRYSAISGATNAEHIIDAGGTGSDNTSIWMVQWGEDTAFGIFPKGSQAGLVHNDYGEVTVEVTAGVAGNRMRALQERWQWKAGQVVKDWRNVVRIANIDVSDLNTASAADINEALETADELLPAAGGKRVIYMNRRVRRYFRRQIREGVSAGGGITFENINGKRVATWGGVPIRTVDAILNTEARVV